jgi:polyhydroxybutyrate depolymerase
MSPNHPLRAIALLALLCAGAAGATVERSTDVGGVQRTWLLHEPPGVALAGAPLLIALHPMNTSGAIMESLSGFSAIADREGFIVVYPNAVGSLWDYGQARYANDDIGFIQAIVDTLTAERGIDRGRVYATGMSAGAIFSLVLAVERPDLIVAAAPDVGGMLQSEADRLPPALPVSVLMINGTADRFVPYAGTYWPGFGRLLPTETTANRWATADRCGAPRSEAIPDLDASDGCTATLTVWPGGLDGSEVRLISIQGGGHTWPGSPQTSAFGPVCMDFDASETIWRFLSGHARSAPSGDG